MKRLLITALTATMLAAGCASEDTTPDLTTSSTTSTTSESSTTTSSSIAEPTSSLANTTSEEPTTPQTIAYEQPAPAPTEAPATAPAPVEAPQAEAPYVVECLDGVPGPALWSDGTRAHSQWCWEQRGGAAYAEAEANAGLPAPAEQTPPQHSPWVQGQIDWTNCLNAGNTEEYCREILN